MVPNQSERRLLSVSQIAKVINISPQQISNRIRASKIPVMRTGTSRTCPYRLTVDQTVALFGQGNPDGLRRALLVIP